MRKHRLMKTAVLMVLALMTLTLLLTGCSGKKSSSKKDKSRKSEEIEEEDDRDDSKEKFENLFGLKSDGKEEEENDTGEEGEKEEKKSSLFSGKDMGPQLVYEENGFKITFDGITSNDGEETINLNFTAENTSGGMRDVQIHGLKVNGLYVEGDMSGTVDEGSSEELTCRIYKDTLQFGGISDIESLEISFYIDGAQGFFQTDPAAVEVRPGGGNSYRLAEGEEIFSDEGGIVINYLGSLPYSREDDDYTLYYMFFSVENHSQVSVSFYECGDEILVDGTADDDTHIMGDTYEVGPYSDGVLRMEFFSMVPDVTSVDFDTKVFMNREDICTVPLHARGSGDKVEIAADEMILSDNFLRMVEMQESEAAREQAEQEAERTVANAAAAEVTETGFFNYMVGSSYNNANCTAVIKNPNTDVYLTRIKVKFTALDESGNVLAEQDYNSISDLTLRPGESAAVNATFKTGEAAASVKAEVIKAEPVTVEDGRRREEDGDYAVLTEDFTVDECQVMVGTVMKYTTYYLDGKITNKTSEEGRIWMLIVLRDSAGQIVYGDTNLLTGVAPDTQSDFHIVLADNEIPDFYKIEVTLLKD